MEDDRPLPTGTTPGLKTGDGVTIQPSVLNLDNQIHVNEDHSDEDNRMVDVPHDEMLEVDMMDYDSAIGDVTTSEYSQSVTSNAYRFIEENGRTYHSYKEGQYFLPNDESEQERLDLQHQLWLLTIGHRLHLAPTRDDQLHNVLDIGTGTGIWCIEFALRNPQSHVIGTDLSPIQPEFVPPNCTFEVEDAEDEWIFPHPFDLIHGRTLASCFRKPQRVVDSAVAALRPGGWLEFQDIILPPRGLDSTFSGTYIEKWCDMVMHLGQCVGRDFGYSQRYRHMFHEAGLEEVQERHFVWPTSPWCKGEHLKKVSLWAQKDFIDGMEGMSMALMTRVGGMTKEEVLEFLRKVKEDVMNRNIHVYVPVTVVMGRKPLEKTSA